MLKAEELPVKPAFSLFAAVIGFFIVTLDSFVVNVALPAMGRELGGGIAGLQWVIDGYTLMFAALLLSSGALSDRIGARRAFGVGTIVFVVASIACGFSPTIGALVAARLAQGSGAALLLPASLALVREAYHDEKKRGHAIAMWAIGGAVASSAGPVVGGFLTEVSWRLIFYINVPFGLLILLLLIRVPHSPVRGRVPLDWTGQTAAIVGMGALTFGLIEGGNLGFRNPFVILALAIAVVALITLVVSQIHGRHPMVPPRLFRSLEVQVSLAVGFAFVVGFYGLVFLLSLYYQQIRSLSSSQTGLAFLPMTALSAFINPVAARIAARFGAKIPMVAGQLLMAAGLLLLSLAAAAGAPVVTLALIAVAVGLGAALSVPTMTALLVGSAPHDLVGTASGVLNTFRQFGGAIAIAVFGALVAHKEHFMSGMTTSLSMAVVIFVVTAAATLSLPRHRAG